MSHFMKWLNNNGRKDFVIKNVIYYWLSLLSKKFKKMKVYSKGQFNEKLRISYISLIYDKCVNFPSKTTMDSRRSYEKQIT